MKEKTADEMFESINFHRKDLKDFSGNIYAYSYGRDCDYIDFMLENKEICFNNSFENPMYFSVKDFNIISKAINKKCQELGWLDE